jgi:hypothetical protein
MEIWVGLIVLAELLGAPSFFAAEARKYSKQNPPPRDARRGVAEATLDNVFAWICWSRLRFPDGALVLCWVH